MKSSPECTLGMVMDIPSPKGVTKIFFSFFDVKEREMKMKRVTLVSEIREKNSKCTFMCSI